MKPILLDLDLGLPILQNCEEINICCLSPSVYGILLWQPEVMKRPSLDQE